LSAWCWDYARETGDARYCFLWRSLEMLWQCFEENGISAIIVHSWDAALAEYMPEVLQADSPQGGTYWAALLHEQLMHPSADEPASDQMNQDDMRAAE